MKRKIAIFSMTEQKLSLKLAYFFSLLALFLMFSLAIFIGVSFETNDDLTIAHVLSQNSYYCIFVGKVLSATIHYFYRLFPNISLNWWLIFSVLAISLGISSVIYVIIRKNSKLIALSLSLVIFIAGWYFAIFQMNFTRTAMAISVGGLALISYALSLDNKKHRYILWVLGLFFMLIGGGIRYECSYIALGFLAVNEAIFLIRQGNIFKREWLLKNKNIIILLLFTAIIIFAAPKVDKFFLTQNEQQVRSFQNARSDIRDYYLLYPKYITHAEKYSKYGISENDWKLFNEWIDGDTDFFSYDRLVNIGSLKEKTNVLNGIKNVILLLITKPLGWLLMFFPVMIIAINPKRNFYSIVAVACFTIIPFLYLIYLGRLKDRVTDSIFWGALVSLWISSDFSRIIFKKYFKFVSCCFLTVWLLVTFYSTKDNCQLISILNESYTIDYDSIEIFDYIDKHKDNVYIPTVTDSGEPFFQLYIWKPKPYNYCSNIVNIGGWNSRLPSAIEQWDTYHIGNPMQALLYDDVYLYYKSDQKLSADLVLEYLREHYSESVQVHLVYKIGSYNIIKYYR